MIKLIPVIDILNGQVVRGIAGERDRYQPNESKLLEGSDPVETATAFIESFDVERIYIADLDAFTGVGSSAEIIKAISALPVKTVVDAAAKTTSEVSRLLDLGVEEVVVPLESLSSLQRLHEIVEGCDVSRLVFSLDLKSGKPMGKLSDELNPLAIAEIVYEAGIRKMIVLDLAGVGVSAGVPTIELSREIKANYPDFVIWTGGGIRSIGDVRALNAAELDGVLIASALHDKKIELKEWESCGI